MSKEVVTSTRRAELGTFGTAMEMVTCRFDGTNMVKVEDPNLVDPNALIEAFVCRTCGWVTFFLKRQE